MRPYQISSYPVKPEKGITMKIRIQAQAIRDRLIARHSNPVFRSVLAKMSDEELVAREAQHHAEAVAYLAGR